MNSKHLFMFSLVFDLQYTVKSQKNLMSLFLDGGEEAGGGVGGEGRGGLNTEVLYLGGKTLQFAFFTSCKM